MQRFRATALPTLATLSLAALAALTHYAWPGNVRELRNAMERAVALSVGDEVLLEHLPARIASAPPEASAAEPVTRPSPLGSLEEIDAARAALERQRLIEALEKCGGNQTRAAEVLGISRRTLVTRMGDYGLPRPRKRE